MGITIGDSLSVVAILVGVGLSTWALIVALGLLLSNKTAAAQHVIENTTWKSLIAGLLILFTVGIVALGLVGSPNPAAKLVGTLILLWLLGHSAIGMAGLAKIAADRVKAMDAEVSPYRAFVRGAGFLVVAGFLPFIGWFGFGPLMLILATGAGFIAVFRKESSSVEVRA